MSKPIHWQDADARASLLRLAGALAASDRGGGGGDGLPFLPPLIPPIRPPLAAGPAHSSPPPRAAAAGGGWGAVTRVHVPAARDLIRVRQG